MAHSNSIVDHFWVVLPTILRGSLNDSAITVEGPLVEDIEDDPEDDFEEDTGIDVELEGGRYQAVCSLARLQLIYYDTLTPILPVIQPNPGEIVEPISY
jgi:hypothetical protein